jgi:hypothetical protein
MEIKFFKTIDEWVKSNPDDEIIPRVLNTVNKGVIRKASGLDHISPDHIDHQKPELNACC